MSDTNAWFYMYIYAYDYIFPIFRYKLETSRDFYIFLAVLQTVLKESWLIFNHYNKFLDAAQEFFEKSWHRLCLVKRLDFIYTHMITYFQYLGTG